MDELKWLKVSDIKTSELAQELAKSNHVYIDFYAAKLKGLDGKRELEAIRALPLERRYTWRIVSALMWAFEDFDSENIRLDRETLSLEDMKKMIDMVGLRSAQFAIFMSALHGK